MRKMRWMVVFLCFLAIAINYVDRANLAVAAPQIEKALNIGPAQMGLVMSGFFWTYALMQMPFGWFAGCTPAAAVTSVNLPPPWFLNSSTRSLSATATSGKPSLSKSPTVHATPVPLATSPVCVLGTRAKLPLPDFA